MFSTSYLEELDILITGGRGACFTFMEALEVSGMPFSYFPEMMPHASGDHVMAPTPVTTGTIRQQVKRVVSFQKGVVEIDIYIDIKLHLGHGADAFAQSNLQYVTTDIST